MRKEIVSGIIKSVICGLIVFAFTSSSLVVLGQEALDIDRGGDTGVRGWNKVTQYFNNAFYGY